MGFTWYSHWTFVSYSHIICRALHHRCVLMEEHRTSMQFWMWLEKPRSLFTLPSWTMFPACCMLVNGMSWCCSQVVFSPLLVVSESGVFKVFSSEFLEDHVWSYVLPQCNSNLYRNPSLIIVCLKMCNHCYAIHTNACMFVACISINWLIDWLIEGSGGPCLQLSLGRVLISLTWAFEPVGGYTTKSVTHGQCVARFAVIHTYIQLNFVSASLTE